jgi:hypothetical protein
MSSVATISEPVNLIGCVCFKENQPRPSCLTCPKRKKVFKDLPEGSYDVVVDMAVCSICDKPKLKREMTGGTCLECLEQDCSC